MSYLRSLFRKKKTVDNQEQIIQIFDDFSCKEPKTFEFNLKNMTSGDLLVYIQKEFEKNGNKINNQSNENKDDNLNFDLFILMRPKKNVGGSVVCRKLNFFEVPMRNFPEKENNFEVNLIYFRFNQEFYNNEFNCEKNEENTKSTNFSNNPKKNCKKNGLIGFFICFLFTSLISLKTKKNRKLGKDYYTNLPLNAKRK